MKKNEVIFLVGLPGSGKSTWLRNFLSESLTEYVVCSTDAIFETKSKECGMTYDQAFAHFSFKEVEKEFKQNIRDAVEAGKNVVLDRTNLSPKARRKFLTYFPASYTKTAVLFDFSDMEQIQERLRRRQLETGKTVSSKTLAEMIAMYEEPTTADFDRIIKQ